MRRKVLYLFSFLIISFISNLYGLDAEEIISISKGKRKDELLLLKTQKKDTRLFYLDTGVQQIERSFHAHDQVRTKFYQGNLLNQKLNKFQDRSYDMVKFWRFEKGS